MIALCDTCEVNLAEHDLRFSPQHSLLICSPCLATIKQRLAKPAQHEVTQQSKRPRRKQQVQQQTQQPSQPAPVQSAPEPTSERSLPPMQNYCQTCHVALISASERQEGHCTACVDKQWGWYRDQQHDATRYRQTPRTGFTRPPYLPQQNRNGR